MRAVLVETHGAPEACALREVPVPAPGPGQALIEVHAIGVNYPDLLVIGGQYQILPPLPFSPGKEVAGRIAAVGAGVEGLAPGDRVLAQLEHGGYAEAVAAPAVNCYPLPQRMDYATAVALGLPYQTAHFALRDRAGFREGESVLIGGASGAVGLAAVQLVKALGGTALAGISTPAKAAAVREAGADHLIDLNMPNLRDGLREAVREATGGRGADIVLDPLGGDFFDAALRALAWRGRLVVVGFAAGRIPSLKANYLLVKNIAVSGLQWSDYRDRTPDWVSDVQRELFDLWEAGRLNPLVAGTYPLERFADALDAIRSRRALGRIVLTTDRDD